jgi:hypothetical protein
LLFCNAVDIKVYFDFGTDIFRDRQEVLNRVSAVEFPPGVQPELSPWWAIAEIYRYEMTGEPGVSLTELKTLQDWQVRRAFRRIPVKPGMPVNATSIGMVICRSIFSADHPGFWVINSTMGGEGSGYAMMSSRWKA